MNGFLASKRLNICSISSRLACDLSWFRIRVRHASLPIEHGLVCGTRASIPASHQNRWHGGKAWIVPDGQPSTFTGRLQGGDLLPLRLCHKEGRCSPKAPDASGTGPSGSRIESTWPTPASQWEATDGAGPAFRGCGGKVIWRMMTSFSTLYWDNKLREPPTQRSDW